MLRKTILFGLQMFCLSCFSYGQTDSALTEKPKIVISGFTDVFYCYDGNKPTTNYRQTFLFNHNRHNEVNVNLALLKLSVTHSRYRANIAFHAGTYVQDNYANEPEGVRQINEANIGVALNKKNSLWLDAGILPSHIGFESAISKDNWNLTRSLLADNSPYFLTGVKITFNRSKRWEFAGLICNGWQVIQREYSNNVPAIGTQMKYTPNDKFTFNWSTYIGTEDTGTRMVMRYFSNLYAKLQVSQKIGLTVGFDYGIQEIAFEQNKFDQWMSPVAIVRYAINKQWAIAMRGEYFEDKNAVVVYTSTGSFATTGVSLNLDYSPIENVLCRIEGRWFKSIDNAFVRNNTSVDDDYFITSSIALSF